jgi:PAS domain S-box-containing protein
MTGYTEDELRNLTVFDISHEDDRKLLRTLPRNPMEPASAGVYEVEKRYRRKDGRAIWAHVNPFTVSATERTPAFLC